VKAHQEDGSNGVARKARSASNNTLNHSYGWWFGSVESQETCLLQAWHTPDFCWLRLIYQTGTDNSQSSLSFTFAENDKIRTLSTTSTTAGNDIDGLLYTPQLPPGVCVETALHVPENATKPTNLPAKKTISLIAVAPWINQNCTLSYLKAVQADPIRAFIFYLTDNKSDIPPLANDPIWTLKDAGRWKGNNHFPVYAIPSTTGQKIMEQLAAYSGNVTQVPNGHELANDYPANYFIRLAAEIDVGE
jgi:hypothetical protein